MKERDLAIFIVNGPSVSYNFQDNGLYLQGAASPLFFIKIEKKPEGSAVLTAPNFYDVADDPDFVAAGPMDIIIQNAIGSLIDAQEAARRVAGIRSMMPQTGYYVINASEEPESGELSAQTIKDVCQEQNFTLVKEQPMVCKQDNGILRRNVLFIYRK